MADGTTVVLTTQYLDEADQLADQICVIDTGRVIANGTPDELKSRIGGDRVDVVLHDAADLPAAAAIVERAAGALADIDPDNRRVSAPVQDRMRVMSEVFAALGAANLSAEDLAVRRPTLDEVFMELTGRPAEPAPDTTTEEAA